MKKKMIVNLLIGFFLLVMIGIANASIINVATSGTASQSSTGIFDSGTGYASNAIDGNTNGSWDYTSSSADGQTISHTYQDSQAFWQVQLEQVYLLDAIVIWNRIDNSLASRINDFNITIFDTTTATPGVAVWESLGNSWFNPSFSVDLTNNGVIGDLVKIQLIGTNYLHLAEVQVFANTNPVPEPATALLFGLGLLGLTSVSRRKK